MYGQMQDSSEMSQKMEPHDGNAASAIGNDQNLNRTTLSDQVAEGILSLVIERGLKKGDSIPSTGEFAEHFGVSRTVIREAFAELAGRGLLLRQQGKESRLDLPGSKHLQDLLAARLDHDGIDRFDLHEFRSVIEIGAARIAARNRSEQDVTVLKEALHALEIAHTDEELHAADIKLHRGVAAASHNPLFPLVLDALERLLYESRSAAWQEYVTEGGTTAVAIDRHRQIVRSIEAKDAVGTVEALVDDLADTLEMLRRGYQRTDSNDGVR